MFNEAFDLAPGEILADRFDPADATPSAPAPVSATELAAWEAAPWF